MSNSTAFVFHISGHNSEIENYVVELKQALQDKGITAIVTTQNNRIDSNILKALNTKMVLIFADSQTSNTPDIVFFYSLTEKKEGSKLIASILKEIAMSNNKITFDILAKWQQLFRLNYFKLLSDKVIPSVLIEIRNIKIITDLKETSKSWILNSLSNVFGNCIAEIPAPEIDTTDIGDIEAIDVSIEGDTIEIDIPEVQYTCETIEAENSEKVPELEYVDETKEEDPLDPVEMSKTEYQPPKKRTRKRWGRIINPLNPPYDGPIYPFQYASTNNALPKAFTVQKCSSNEKRIYIPSR